MVDEQARHEAFEFEVGGPNRGFRLMRMWQDCANPCWGTMPHTDAEKAAKRLEIFQRRAKTEGYTPRQVEMFLALQGH